MKLTGTLLSALVVSSASASETTGYDIVDDYSTTLVKSGVSVSPPFLIIITTILKTISTIFNYYFASKYTVCTYYVGFSIVFNGCR